VDLRPRLRFGNLELVQTASQTEFPVVNPASKKSGNKGFRSGGVRCDGLRGKTRKLTE
jgi:hypothetical protein